MNTDKAEGIKRYIISQQQIKVTGPLLLKINFNQGGITDVEKIEMKSEKIEVWHG